MAVTNNLAGRQRQLVANWPVLRGGRNGGAARKEPADSWYGNGAPKYLIVRRKRKSQREPIGSAKACHARTAFMRKRTSIYKFNYSSFSPAQAGRVNKHRDALSSKKTNSIPATCLAW